MLAVAGTEVEISIRRVGCGRIATPIANALVSEAVSPLVQRLFGKVHVHHHGILLDIQDPTHVLVGH